MDYMLPAEKSSSRTEKWIENHFLNGEHIFDITSEFNILKVQNMKSDKRKRCSKDPNDNSESLTLRQVVQTETSIGINRPPLNSISYSHVIDVHKNNLLISGSISNSLLSLPKNNNAIQMNLSKDEPIINNISPVYPSLPNDFINENYSDIWRKQQEANQLQQMQMQWLMFASAMMGQMPANNQTGSQTPFLPHPLAAALMMQYQLGQMPILPFGVQMQNFNPYHMFANQDLLNKSKQACNLTWCTVNKAQPSIISSALPASIAPMPIPSTSIARRITIDQNNQMNTSAPTPKSIAFLANPDEGDSVVRGYSRTSNYSLANNNETLAQKINNTNDQSFLFRKKSCDSHCENQQQSSYRYWDPAKKCCTINNNYFDYKDGQKQTIESNQNEKFDGLIHDKTCANHLSKLLSSAISSSQIHTPASIDGNQYNHHNDKVVKLSPKSCMTNKLSRSPTSPQTILPLGKKMKFYGSTGSQDSLTLSRVCQMQKEIMSHQPSITGQKIRSGMGSQLNFNIQESNGKRLKKDEVMSYHFLKDNQKCTIAVSPSDNNHKESFIYTPPLNNGTEASYFPIGLKSPVKTNKPTLICSSILPQQNAAHNIKNNVETKISHPFDPIGLSMAFNAPPTQLLLAHQQQQFMLAAAMMGNPGFNPLNPSGSSEPSLFPMVPPTSLSMFLPHPPFVNNNTNKLENKNYGVTVTSSQQTPSPKPDWDPNNIMQQNQMVNEAQHQQFLAAAYFMYCQQQSYMASLAAKGGPQNGPQPINQNSLSKNQDDGLKASKQPNSMPDPTGMKIHRDQDDAVLAMCTEIKTIPSNKIVKIDKDQHEDDNKNYTSSSLGIGMKCSTNAITSSFSKNVNTTKINIPGLSEYVASLPPPACTHNINTLPYIPRTEKFVCSSCDKVFMKQSQLTLHLNVHLLEKPFKCEACQSSFRNKGMLQKHRCMAKLKTTSSFLSQHSHRMRSRYSDDMTPLAQEQLNGENNASEGASVSLLSNNVHNLSYHETINDAISSVLNFANLQSQSLAHSSSNKMDENCSNNLSSNNIIMPKNNNTGASTKKNNNLGDQMHTVSKNNTLNTDPRPFKCEDCQVAFRIQGHLSKHLRSKMHITGLEKNGKVPIGTYAFFDQRASLNDIDTTSCTASLESLHKLLKQNDLFTQTATTITTSALGKNSIVGPIMCQPNEESCMSSDLSIKLNNSTTENPVTKICVSPIFTQQANDKTFVSTNNKTTNIEESNPLDNYKSIDTSISFAEKLLSTSSSDNNVAGNIGTSKSIPPPPKKRHLAILTNNASSNDCLQSSNLNIGHTEQNETDKGQQQHTNNVKTKDKKKKSEINDTPIEEDEYTRLSNLTHSSSKSNNVGTNGEKTIVATNSSTPNHPNEHTNDALYNLDILCSATSFCKKINA